MLRKICFSLKSFFDAIQINQNYIAKKKTIKFENTHRLHITMYEIYRTIRKCIFNYVLTVNICSAII